MVEFRKRSCVRVSWQKHSSSLDGCCPRNAHHTSLLINLGPQRLQYVYWPSESRRPEAHIDFIPNCWHSNSLVWFPSLMEEEHLRKGRRDAQRWRARKERFPGDWRFHRLQDEFSPAGQVSLFNAAVGSLHQTFSQWGVFSVFEHWTKYCCIILGIIFRLPS